MFLQLHLCWYRVSPSLMILTAVRYCIVQIYYKSFISFLLADYKLPLFPTTTKMSFFFFSVTNSAAISTLQFYQFPYQGSLTNTWEPFLGIFLKMEMLNPPVLLNIAKFFSKLN